MKKIRNAGEIILPGVSICAAEDVPDILSKTRPGLLISISDPDQKAAIPASFTGHLLRFEFLDHAHPSADERSPGVHHIDSLIKELETRFPVGMPDILAHCQLGMSRSPAMAAASLCWEARRQCDDPDLITQAVLPKIFSAAPEALPNMAIIHLTDRRLGLSGRLIEACETRMDEILGKSEDPGLPY